MLCFFMLVYVVGICFDVLVCVLPLIILDHLLFHLIDSLTTKKKQKKQKLISNLCIYTKFNHIFIMIIYFFSFIQLTDLPHSNFYTSWFP